jgi:hypothetical protein
MKQIGPFLILGLLCLVLGGGAAAQEPPELSSLSIALWPEFDRPEMLVIYQGALTSETTLPAAVEFRIPARVGRPTAVAFLSDAGERFNQQHTTRVEGENLVVSFVLSSPGFQLEYYDALPVSAGGEREYDFDYTADYATGDLSVEFQVPPTAEGLVVEPSAGTAATGIDGLLYHRIPAGAVASGETVGWTFRYVKGDESLTYVAPTPAPTQQPAAVASTGGASSDGDSAVLIFVVAFVALLGVGGAAFWLGRSTRPPGGEAPAGPAGAAWPEPSRRRQAANSAFCYKCGTDLRPDADFCHRCGAPVRS